MSEAAAVVVDSQPMDVTRGPLVSMTPEERTEFRKTGTMPEPPKVEDAAPSKTSSETDKVEPAGDSEPPPQQEKKPKPTAEERIAQLESTIEKIRKGAGLDKTPKVESSPTPEKPQADKEPTPEDQNADGTPKYKSYEEFTKAQARWEVRQEIAEQKRLEAQQARDAAFNAKVAEARTRYDKFDEVVGPTAETINTDPAVFPVVKQMLLDSEVLPDLLFTIGSSKEELASFVKMAKENPGKALRYIALTESLINEELEKKPAEPPAKPQTQAPKPPAEVGGRAATPADALEAAAKAGDFRAFKAEANRRELARLKG